LFDGSTVVWGAVGFRNGGGNDSAARADADAKFRSDLQSMLEENPQLQAFVFFTNVDLPPAQHTELTTHARGRGIRHVEIFDFERLRHVLDSPAGLIARLQYLGITMSPTEQAALVDRYGRELQRVVTTRLDRVQRTLAEMEDFMAFQRPVFRFDVTLEFREDVTSKELGTAALLLDVRGLRGPVDGVVFLVRNQPEHASAASGLAFRLTTWVEDHSIMDGASHSVFNHPKRATSDRRSILVPGWFHLLRVGSNHVRLVDLTLVQLEAVCTKALHSKLKRIALDVNGYALFECDAEEGEAMPVPERLPDGLSFDAAASEWASLVKVASRDCLFEPPKQSGRLLPLTVVAMPQRVRSKH